MSEPTPQEPSEELRKKLRETRGCGFMDEENGQHYIAQYQLWCEKCLTLYENAALTLAVEDATRRERERAARIVRHKAAGLPPKVYEVAGMAFVALEDAILNGDQPHE